MTCMASNRHPFFGLAADAVARKDFRKSRFMLASSFLVGNFFNSSRFCFASIGDSL